MPHTMSVITGNCSALKVPRDDFRKIVLGSAGVGHKVAAFCGSLQDASLLLGILFLNAEE